MALVDIYTDRNEPAGYAVEKKEAHAKGLWHRVFTCLIINKDTKSVFLQKKTPGRYSFDRPDYMDVTVGGHYEAGEKIEDGIRELKEETGFHASFNQLISIGQRQTSVILAEDYNNNEFQHIFLFPTDKQIENFEFIDTEVRGIVEIPVIEGIKLMRGEIKHLEVKSCFANSDLDSKKEIITLNITQEDFVPAYLKTDEFMIRLFIAAHRYLAGEAIENIYW